MCIMKNREGTLVGWVVGVEGGVLHVSGAGPGAREVCEGIHQDQGEIPDPGKERERPQVSGQGWRGGASARQSQERRASA